MIGQANDAFDLITQARQAGLEGESNKFKVSALSRFLVNNTVGNMPVVRHALDYLILNDMAETLNPGYTERMRTRLENQGQHATFAGKGSGILDAITN